MRSKLSKKKKKNKYTKIYMNHVLCSAFSFRRVVFIFKKLCSISPNSNNLVCSRAMFEFVGAKVIRRYFQYFFGQMLRLSFSEILMLIIYIKESQIVEEYSRSKKR